MALPDSQRYSQARGGVIIMSFIIPVVFYEITNVECVYLSNTTIFIGRI